MVESSIAYARPLLNPAGVEDTLKYKLDGPFTTKAGADLYVGWAFPSSGNGLSLPKGMNLENFLKVDKNEESMLIEDVRKTYPEFNESIKGDRLYFQTNIKGGAPEAGKEFHRIRRELIFPITGQVDIEFEDVYGRSKQTHLSPGEAVIIPPFVMHTLNFPVDSSIGIKANTLFFFEYNGQKIGVPDAYSREAFEKLKGQFK